MPFFKVIEMSKDDVIEPPVHLVLLGSGYISVFLLHTCIYTAVAIRMVKC